MNLTEKTWSSVGEKRCAGGVLGNSGKDDKEEDRLC